MGSLSRLCLNSPSSGISFELSVNILFGALWVVFARELSERYSRGAVSSRRTLYRACARNNVGGKCTLLWAELSTRKLLHVQSSSSVACAETTMDGDIGTWARSIPIVTRYWFFSFLILPLTTRLNLIYWPNLILDWTKLVSGFQVAKVALFECNWSSPHFSLLFSDMAAHHGSIMVSRQLSLAHVAVFSLQLLSSSWRRLLNVHASILINLHLPPGGKEGDLCSVMAA